MKRRWSVVATIIASLCIALAGQAAADQYPVIYNFGYGLAVGATAPGSSPPGSNNFACRPSPLHPDPVVLVHGTFGNMTVSWQALSALLVNNGYCVFALDYGGSEDSPIKATGDIPTSAAQLAAFVDQVRAATGAKKVDIVGHSQGGMMPRWYLRFLGGRKKVDTLVGLAPSSHGTDLDGLGTLAASFGGSSDVEGCAACGQQVVGSDFMNTLNAGGDTERGVHYTVIATMHDEVVTPYQTQFLSGPDVTNFTLQDVCVLDRVDHVGMIYDEVALHLVLNALDPLHATPAPCTVVLPGVGG